MNVLPVIQRELRAQARLTFTYWLRVLGAGALIAVAVHLRRGSGATHFPLTGARSFLGTSISPC